MSPNPSPDGAVLSFALPAAASVLVEIYDPAGRRLGSPLGRGWVEMPAGPGIHRWDGRMEGGRRLPPGVYFVRMLVRDALGETARTFKWSLLR